MGGGGRSKESTQTDIPIEVGGGKRVVTFGSGVSQFFKKIYGWRGAQKKIPSFFVSVSGGGGVGSASFMYGTKQKAGGVDNESETKKRWR